MAQASKKTKIIAICICLIVIIVCSVGYCYFLPSEIAFVFSGGVIGGTIPLSIFVYDMMKERKRKPNIKHQTAPVQIKPRMAVILKRCSVCAGDDMDAPHDGTLNVESVDDLVYHLEHYDDSAVSVPIVALQSVPSYHCKRYRLYRCKRYQVF
jgi:hypothetical protein